MSSEAAFNSFYKDLKATEKADSVLTPKQQIERLLRPGSTYRNLNPYEVLQIDPELPIEDIRKKYRRLSILVHPDKNQDDPDRAQAAFDAVKKAYALLDDEKTRKKCFELVEEARGRTQQNMQEKRKKIIKEVKAKGLKPEGDNIKIEEDNPEAYKNAVHILTMKLFADLERRRRQLETKASEEAAKKREAELAAEERKNVEKEFAKNWEESRQGRVDSWLSFKSGKPTAYIPPGAATAATAAPTAAPKIQHPTSSSASYSSFGGITSTTSTGFGTFKPATNAAASSTEVNVEKKKKKKEKRFSPMGFRPPKHKPESR